MLAKIGEVEVWRILETVDPLMPVFRFFPELTPEMLDACADAILPGTLRADPKDGALWLVIPVQSFLLKTPHHVILIDACLGNDKTFPPFPQWSGMKGDRFMASLQAADVRVEDVDIVLCTHLHMDHVGWTTRLQDGLWVPTFPNAKVLAMAEEITLAESLAKDAKPEEISGWMFEETIKPLLEAGRLMPISPEDQIDPSIRIFPTPGHMPGHISIEILAGNAPGGFVTGDALHASFQCALPDQSPIADADPIEAAQSRRKMLAHLCDTGALAFGTHIPLPSLGRIREKGDTWTWDPVV